MGILRWAKHPEYSESDEQLVRLHLTGKFPAARIKQKVIGDIYQKYDGETGEKLPKEKHEVFESDRQSRLNWAALRRALVRLERSGYVTSFHLYYDGQLYVKWFSPQPEKEQVATGMQTQVCCAAPACTIKHIEILQESCVKTLANEDRDIRHKQASGPIPMIKSQTHSVKSKDYVPGMPEFARNEMWDHINLHSIASQVQRAKDFFEIKPSFGDKWPARFKFNPDYFSGAVNRRSAEQQQIERGYCVWPSQIYKLIQ